MKTVKWFAITLAAALGLGSGAAIIANAAPGDLVIQDRIKSEVSASVAGSAKTFAVTNCGWDADGALERIAVFKDPLSSTGYSCVAVGERAVAPADLPVGNGPVQVIGIVEE